MKNKIVFVFVTNIKVYNLFTIKLIDYLKKKNFQIKIIIDINNYNLLIKKKFVLDDIEYIILKLPNSFTEINNKFLRLVETLKNNKNLIFTPCLYPVWMQVIVNLTNSKIFYYQNGQNMSYNETYLDNLRRKFKIYNYLKELVNNFYFILRFKVFYKNMILPTPLRFKYESYFGSKTYFKKIDTFICFENSFKLKINTLNKRNILINLNNKKNNYKKNNQDSIIDICFAPTYWLPLTLFKYNWKEEIVCDYFAMHLKSSLFPIKSNYNLYIRLHPLSDKSFWKNVINNLDKNIKSKIKIDNNKNIEILNYLEKFDYVISDISSIKIAANSMNIPVLNYNVLEGFRK